jgi:uncharacterized membrane protein YhaH (DUF805 family)
MVDFNSVGMAVLGDSYLQLIPLLMGALAFILIFAIALYIYSSLAFMAIAKKAGYPHPGIVWIPIIGTLIVTANIAKMHWWPILLLLLTWIPYAGIVFSIAVLIFSIIWMWKTFEAVKKPGWWILLNFIPLVGTIVFLILLGIAAWSKDSSPKNI